MNKAGLLASILGAAATWGCLDPTASDPSSGLRIAQVERNSIGTPYFVSGELGQVAGDVARQPEALASVLPAIASTLGIAGTDLAVRQISRDEIGMTHVRLAQHKNGLRVVSGDAILSLDGEGIVRSVSNGAIDRDLPATPSVAADTASQLAVAATPGKVAAHGSELVYVISNVDGEMYLAWEVIVKATDGQLLTDRVYVDALEGRVVDRHPRVFTAKSRRILNGNGGVFPVANAPVVATEGVPPTEAIALAAYNNTGLTYDCYKELYNRDSYNALGAVLTSQVHVVFPVGDGTNSPNNAAWVDDLQMMAYGDGDGVNIRPFALSLDVTAHELTHAVTSSTADLIYSNESGALNESMSDIMGAVCEAWKLKAVTPTVWLVGDEIMTPNIAGDALRYMDSPTKDGVSPDYYPERYLGTQDNGGVHINSGLPNLAFYLLSQGGKHPRNKTTLTVPGVGIDRAGAIFQRALTTKWTTTTNLAAGRTGAEAAAAELYPNTCAKTSVSLAFAAVGVGPAVPADVTPPTVAITSPSAGTKVKPGFEVSVNTTDDQCIDKVELLVDNTVVKTVNKAPYTFTADGIAQGSHTITVKAYDAFNSATSTAMQVTVSGNGNGMGGGNGDGDGDADGDGQPDGITGGCSTGGSGASLLLGLSLVGLAIRRRK